MGILVGKGKTRLNGQKSLTAEKGINTIVEANLLYVPLAIGNATDFEIHVNEGDVVKQGQKLATRQGMYVPIYAPVSGVIKGFEKRMHKSGRPQNHIVIENDFNHDISKVVLNGSDQVLNKNDIEKLTPEEIVEAIKELGIVGLGGAAFPTYIKYGKTEGIDTILINGVECEPFITSDYLIMKQEIDALFAGVALMMKAATAKKGIIAIKVGKPELLAKLKAKQAEYPQIEIKEVVDAYPLGWERTLIREIFKKEYDRLPGELGIIVNNATTAIAIAKGIIEKDPITHRVVTISGDALVNPQNVLVAIGTPVNHIIEQIGGYAGEVGIVISGGPMMGRSVMNDEFVVDISTNAITVLKRKDIPPIACLRCGSCIDHCPARIQPVKIMDAEKAKNTDKIAKLEALRCVECGMCTFVCPSKIEVTDFVAKAKNRLWNAQKAAEAKGGN